MKYPKEHLNIVQDLLKGKFILNDEAFFRVIKDNFNFYKDFFEKSFNFTLERNSEFIYLSSKETNEKFSRDLMLLLGVLSYELNVDGRNIYEGLNEVFQIDELKRIVDKSSYQMLCRKIDIDNMIREKCRKRNIVKLIDNESFKFTSAINLFLDRAKEMKE